MKTIRCLLIVSAFFNYAAAGAQTQPPDSKQKAEVVNKIAEMLQDNYVFPDVAKQAGQFIQSQLAKGAYAETASAMAFGEKLTADLQSVSHDKHMRVSPMP